MFYLPIQLLPGDADQLRRAATELRRLVGAFEVAQEAAAAIGAIRDGDAWQGEAYEAFRDRFPARPLATACASGQAAMVDAATALDHLARVHDDSQAALFRLRRDAETIAPGGGLVPDDQVPTMDDIHRQARTVWSAYRQEQNVASGHFDRLDDATTFATPPRSGVALVREFVVGIGEAVWDVGQAAILAERLQRDATIWTQAWNDREAIMDTIAYAAEHPDEFGDQVWHGIADLDTLEESPARWLGGLAPTVLAMVLTRGTSLSSRLPRLTKAVETFDEVAGTVEWVEHLGTVADGATALRDQGRRECIDAEIDTLIGALARPIGVRHVAVPTPNPAAGVPDPPVIGPPSHPGVGPILIPIVAPVPGVPDPFSPEATPRWPTPMWPTP